MSLYAEFLNNTGNRCYKWLHYFPIYEKYFSRLTNQDCNVLEIGVSHGGSLMLWKKYLGHRSRIVGIDINENCTKYADANFDIHVRIGDQENLSFLEDIVKEFGMFDIIIDDGGHKMSQISTSFKFLYPYLNKNGFYLVEDLHTCYWAEYGGSANNPNTFINISKNIIDELNADHSRGKVPKTSFSKDTYGIYFHDSIIVFEKGSLGIKKPLYTGKA